MNNKKIFSVLLKISFCFAIFCILKYNTSLATTSTVNELMTKASGASGGVIKTTYNVMAIAVKVIQIVGSGIAIIMLMYVAIKYMSAAPQEKAEFKKSATAMIVGAVVLFGASNILTLIENFADNNIN